MNSIVCKCGIVAAFLIVVHCDNTTTPITTLHPLMNLAVEQQDGASRVIISTTVAKDYTMYRIVDDSCTVTYPWTIMNEDSSYSPIIDSVKVANDSAASQSGTFLGIWEVPDSLFKYGSIRIYACALDETNHSVCASLVVRINASLP